MNRFDDYNTIYDGDDRNHYTPCANCGCECATSDLDHNGVCSDCTKPNVDVLPCPFCGRTPKLIHYEKDGYAFCCDTKNGTHYIETVWKQTEAEAAEIWNHRGE